MSEWLKQKIPDVTLRLTWEQAYGEEWLRDESYWMWRGSPAPGNEEVKVFMSVAALCGITKRGFFIFCNFERKKWQFQTPQKLEAGLQMYHHTPEFLHWLLDALTENEHADKLGEHIIIVQKKLAEIGALDEAGRFEL